MIFAGESSAFHHDEIVLSHHVNAFANEDDARAKPFGGVWLWLSGECAYRKSSSVVDHALQVGAECHMPHRFAAQGSDSSWLTPFVRGRW